MTDDDRQTGDAGGARRALLRDLESIRDLLDAEADAGAAIPVLREIVGAVHPDPAEPRAATPTAHTRPESPSGSATDTAVPPAPADVQGDLFDARGFADRLLDETWQEQSEAILASARRRADALAARLPPETEAALRQALHARLRQDLPPLLEQVIGECIDELQARLLTVLRNEVTRLVDATFADAVPPPQSD